MIPMFMYDIRVVKCILAWHAICYWLHRIKILQWKRKFTLIPLFMVLFKTKMMIENKIWKKILLFVFLHSKASLHAMFIGTYYAWINKCISYRKIFFSHIQLPNNTTLFRGTCQLITYLWLQISQTPGFALKTNII